MQGQNHDVDFNFRSNTTPDDSVSFSVAEGVSTAQNAFPDTYADKKNDYSEQVSNGQLRDILKLTRS